MASPYTINPVTGKPQILGANGLPVPGVTAGSSPAQVNAFSGLSNAPAPPAITAPGAPSAPGAISYTPTTINPSSLAQIVANQYGGATPAPAAQVGNTQIGPASLLNPSQISSITSGNAPDLSTNSTIAQILAGFQPAITQQNSQLQNQLGAFGISGGPAIAAQNNLDVQQGQAEAPAIAQAIQNSQANQLNQGQFASKSLIDALSSNQLATNTQQQNQATLNQQAGISNQGALNTRSNLAAQLAQQAGIANADALNTAQTANVGATNETLATNAATENAAEQAYLQQLQSQWLDQFSAFNSINDAALGAQNDISVQGANSFQTPNTSAPSTGLASALGGLYQPTSRAAPTIPATTTA